MVTIVFWLLLIFSPLLLGQGFKWLIVSLLAFRKYFSPAKPAFRPTALEDLTPEMRQFIGSRIQEFAHEGFEVVANVSIGSSPQTQTFTVLLVNRETNDKAYASGAISQSVRNLEYAVVGDRAVLTGMNMTVNPYPRLPGHDACMFSWESSMRQPFANSIAAACGDVGLNARPVNRCRQGPNSIRYRLQIGTCTNGT